MAAGTNSREAFHMEVVIGLILIVIAVLEILVIVREVSANLPGAGTATASGPDDTVVTS